MAINDSIDNCDIPNDSIFDDVLTNIVKKQFFSEIIKKQKKHKRFFATVNERDNYILNGPFDNSNQSDCVAFLHAMSSKDEGFIQAELEFCKHITKCFAEYLFLTNEDEANFMLGIAVHAIMDSFTPSHTGFQKYEEQNKALHAQGDVIPIKPIKKDKKDEKKEEVLIFDPGQFSEEHSFAVKLMARFVKGYDENELINSVEFKMLKIFFVISDIRSKKEPDKKLGLSDSDLNAFSKQFKGKTKSEINEILKEYNYGDDAYIYADNATNVLVDIYKCLSDKRKEIKTYYDYKSGIATVLEAFRKWKTVYDELHKKESFVNRHNFFKRKFENHWCDTIDLFANHYFAKELLKNDTKNDFSKSTEKKELKSYLEEKKKHLDTGLSAIAAGVDVAVMIGEGIVEKKVESVLEVGREALNMGQDALDTTMEFVGTVIEKGKDAAINTGMKALSMSQEALEKGQQAIDKGKGVAKEIGQELVDSGKEYALAKYNEALAMGELAIEKGRKTLELGRTFFAMITGTDKKVAGFGKEILDGYNKLVEENQKVNPDFNINGGSRKI